MRVTDKVFIKGYNEWCSMINWYTGSVLLKQLKHINSINVKKALYVKIFYEYIQACDHLMVFVNAVKKSNSIVGFKKKIVKCPSRSDDFRYLWTELRKYKRNPYRFYQYLGFGLTKEEYISDKMAFDGFYKAVIVCLKNRFYYTSSGRVSNPLHAFNKITHGFPLYSEKNEKEIFIFIRAGEKIKRVSFRYNQQVAEEICRSLEAMRNSMKNISKLLLEKGNCFNRSPLDGFRGLYLQPF